MCEKPFTPAGSASYTRMEAHPLLQKKPVTVSRRKLTKTRRKTITETKLQADTPTPSSIHRKLKREKTENHDGHNQDHENNGPKKQHTRHPQYTRGYNST
jgi:hypothetical protein